MSSEEPITSGVGLGGEEDLDSASHFIECEKLVSDPGTDALITPGVRGIYIPFSGLPSEEG